MSKTFLCLQVALGCTCVAQCEGIMLSTSKLVLCVVPSLSLCEGTSLPNGAGSKHVSREKDTTSLASESEAMKAPLSRQPGTTEVVTSNELDQEEIVHTSKLLAREVTPNLVLTREPTFESLHTQAEVISLESGPREVMLPSVPGVRETIQGYMKSCLPAHWVPDDVFIVDRFPLTLHGRCPVLYIYNSVFGCH